MKKLIIILLSAITINVYGHNSHPFRDTLPHRDVDSLEMMVSNLQQRYEELGLLRGFVDRQAQELMALRDSNQRLVATAEALVLELDMLKKLGERQDCAIKEVNRDAEGRFSRLHRALNIVVATILTVAILAAIGLCVVFVRSRKNKVVLRKLHSNYEGLSTDCSSIRSDFVRLDSMLLELIDNQTRTNIPQTESQQEGHDLVLKVADEIVRIEANLSHMNASVKGYKQLAKAVERIKTNFRANGYEIVDMLGKPYHEGMKVTANFVTDETLPEGEQLITGVIKPQINYCGKMIQAAQITVNQNL